MRVLVAGPPKTGNIWVERILAEMYGLAVLSPVPRGGARELQDFIDQGKFLERAIFHQHYFPTHDLFAVLRKAGCSVVTILRDPYDTFVSLYHYVQSFPRGFRENNELAAGMIGKPIDHPDVLRFLEHGYRRNLDNASQWLDHADKTTIVRYERLHADGVREVERLTRRLGPVSESEVRRALEASTADKMRRLAAPLRRHIRGGRVGDWREHLGPAHLEVFRAVHGDAVRKLGYPVH